MTLTIKTDHKWKPFKYRNEVPDHILKSEFGYQDDSEIYDGYFCYRGNWYHLDQFMTTHGMPDLKSWSGYASDSYFSGVVIKVSDDCETYQVGTYIS